MLSRRLSRQGFEICCAIDGPAGVQAALDERPDLILMDVALGAMDGWEATTLIRARPETPGSPSSPSRPTRCRATGSAASRWAASISIDTKPVDFARLIRKINGALGVPA